jgi:hypothetical protein
MPKNRTPPPLKWLAEMRARISAEITGRDWLVSYLQHKIDRTEAKLLKLLTEVELHLNSADDKRADLAAVDASILLFDARLRPYLIQPVRAWAAASESAALWVRQSSRICEIAHQWPSRPWNCTSA